MGSANVVVFAQLKPMPSSQETSTIRLPGRNAARSSSRRYVSGSVGILQGAVDHDVAFGEERRQRHPAPFVMTWLRNGALSSWSNWAIRTEWIGDPTAATPRLVSTWTSWMPWAFSAVTAPRAVAPKPMTTAVSRRP